MFKHGHVLWSEDALYKAPFLEYYLNVCGINNYVKTMEACSLCATHGSNSIIGMCILY